MTSKFQVNKTYATRSIGDHNCIYSFTILSRTEKTVTVKGTLIDKTARRGLSIGRYDDAEQFKPFGTHSMCAVISATEEAMALAAHAVPDIDTQF
jgi:hypothetical protein